MRMKAFQMNLRNSFSKPGQKWLKKAFKHAAQKIPLAGYWLCANLCNVPDYFKLGLPWEDNVLLGPKTSAASEGRKQSAHPLREEMIKTGFCAWVWLEYLSFALRTTGSFTRSLMGWFRPRVSSGKACGFQTFFFLFFFFRFVSFVFFFFVILFWGMRRESHQ